MARSLSSLSLVALALAAVSTGCGRHEKLQGQETQKPVSTEEALQHDQSAAPLASMDQMQSDTDVQEAALADSVVEASDALDQGEESLESNSSQVEALSLQEFSLAEEATRSKLLSRSCVEDSASGQAIVKVQRQLAKARVAVSKHVESGVAQSYLESLTRTWSYPGAEGQVKCDATKRFAKPDFEYMSQIKLNVEFVRESSASIFRERDSHEARAAKGKIISKGTREFLYEKGEASSDPKLRNNKVTMKASVSKKFHGKNLQGKEVEFDLSMSTKDGAPLVMHVVRDIESHKAVERTIVSGTKVSQHRNGATVESSYDNVKFVRGENCLLPQSGRITGSISKQGKDARSFTITFADGKATIKLPNGEERVRESRCQQPANDALNKIQ